MLHLTTRKPPETKLDGLSKLLLINEEGKVVRRRRRRREIRCFYYIPHKKTIKNRFVPQLRTSQFKG